MKFGVREICDVVLRAKAKQQVGTKTFYKDEPVCYFDSLKTSTVESAVTTVYAQGGRGNSRLVAWEGEKTVTFTMEDALLSPESFAILAGAQLFDATAEKPLYVHTTEQTTKIAGNDGKISITLSQAPAVANGCKIFVMISKNGELVSEPYQANVEDGKIIVIEATPGYYPDLSKFLVDGQVDPEVVAFVDFYIEKTQGMRQIDITPDKFGGNFYLEASTLFRDTNGVDMPAEFIIPNCSIQSNFTFSMASSGDPSTFTFTIDAFPDYTKFDPTKKVLSAIQIITENSVNALNDKRTATDDDLNAEVVKADKKKAAEVDTKIAAIKDAAAVVYPHQAFNANGLPVDPEGNVLTQLPHAEDISSIKAAATTARVDFNKLTDVQEGYVAKKETLKDWEVLVNTELAPAVMKAENVNGKKF